MPESHHLRPNSRVVPRSAWECGGRRSSARECEGLCAALFVAMDSEIHASSANQVSGLESGPCRNVCVTNNCANAEFANCVC